jgi:hypothetical protein
VAVDEKVAGKIEDDLDAAAGQHALKAVLWVRVPAVPERADVPVKRRRRNVFNVDHMVSRLL